MSTEPSEPLRIEISKQDRNVVVTPIGSADMDEVDGLMAELRQAAGAASETLVLDLQQLTFICSEGLGALLQTRILCRQKQVQIRLVAPTPQVLKILKTTRLDKIMEIFDSIEQALAGS